MTFILSLGVFGVTVFADTIKEIENFALAPDGTKYSYSVQWSNSGDTWIAYSNTEINYVNGGVTSLAGDTVFYKNGSFYASRPAGYRFHWGEMHDIVENGVLISPPVIAPTVGEAIREIIPRLSTQLKNLLPVGVILLSTMLGVSLVPRLVRLFL